MLREYKCIEILMMRGITMSFGIRILAIKNIFLYIFDAKSSLLFDFEYDDSGNQEK